MDRWFPCLSLVACLAAAPGQAQVAVTTQFAASASSLTPTERAALAAHIAEAGRRWTAALALGGPRALEIEVAIDDGIARANGGSLTSGFVGVVGSRNLFEQGVAAELRSGVDPNGSAADARFTFNTSYLRGELWFDPDPVARSATVPLNRTDAFSVILHEFGHALAYNGWANGSGIPPNDYFSTFDRWMLAGAPTVFQGPVAQAVWGSAPALTTGNIHHWGNPPIAAAAKPASPAPAVAWREGRPQPWPGCGGGAADGVPPSADWPADKGATPTLIDELMNGVVFYRGSRYAVGALDLAVLEDVGLPLAAEQRIFGDGFETRR